MTYKYFGCTVSDVVSYYHGTVESDYSTNNISGGAVIDSELAYSEQTVLDALPVSFANVLQNGIPYLSVYHGQNLGMVGISLSDLRITDVMADDNGSNVSICGTRTCPSNLENLYEDTTGATISVTDGIVSIVPFDPTKEYYAAISFTEDVVFGSLKRLIRDLTACRLGSQLFSRGGEDEWVSVRRACEESSKMLDTIKEDTNWMPFELKKLRYFPGTSPIKVKGGISTIKVLRG